MTPHYIARRLIAEGGTTLSEHDCLAKAGTIVVLAEPGAGKTDLLDSFGRALGVARERAGIFRHKPEVASGHALIIDALDEVARQDLSALDGVIVKALELKANTTVLASRASEWSKERNRFIQDCTGRVPTIVHLQPFDEDEQRQLFESHFPSENFEAFRIQANRFGLAPILGNPMFLRLIVEGYIQAGRQIQSKRQLFKDAVDRLASDDGKSTGIPPRPPNDVVVSSASAILAKLLLSGAGGVASVERPGDHQFPYVASLAEDASLVWPSVLNSRLFKPGLDADIHEPVHRIVAEYCGASYLAHRIADPADTLSLKRCLAVIAPNRVPRDDLRGLLGWLAALGNQTIQYAIIDLDPYAVVANGDPAQLTSPSKKRLLTKLRSLSRTDPYFRRADAWRRFNAAGFLTRDLVDDLRPILTEPDDGSHLLDLVLELLTGAPAAAALVPELRVLMLDRDADLTTRILARRCLTPDLTYDLAKEDLATLVAEARSDGLQIAAEFITDEKASPVSSKLLLALFRGLAQPVAKSDLEVKRHANLATARRVAKCLELPTVFALLDDLSSSIVCICAAKHRFDCQCRSEISKVVGILLDRIFEIGPPNLSPERLWSWVRNLNFEDQSSGRDSISVKALSQDAALRQGVQRIAFEGMTDPGQISQMRWSLHDGHIHQGLGMSVEDTVALIDHTFANDNVPLWIAFARSHNPYEKNKHSDILRQKMRRQALDKPAFMREFAKHERGCREQTQHYRDWSRRLKRRRTRDAAIQNVNRTNLAANRSLIEQGRHWGWISGFAADHLRFPDKLKEFDDGVAIAENALDNCFQFLAPHVPSLAERAQGRGLAVAEVLHAACRIRFRRAGSLAGIDLDALRAAKTALCKTSTYAEGEFERLEAAIDARIFPTSADAEHFAREYIQPTLTAATGMPTNLWWLTGQKALEPLKAKLSAEWLESYPDAPLEAIRSLFDIAAATADRAWLGALIERRCDDCLAIPTASETGDQTARREFWFLCHFFFADADRAGIWAAVLSQRDSIFKLKEHSGWWPRDRSSAWPSLNAGKIHRVLDAHVGLWPKVHLPRSWGTGSPPGETAYRFLTQLIWAIEQDQNIERALSVIDVLLLDRRFKDFANNLRSMKASRLRKRALAGLVLPTPHAISQLLRAASVATIEDMRALIIEELELMQLWLRGTETDFLEVFWPGGVRVDENTARNRIVERLQPRLQALDASVIIEHHMAQGNRCDFTAAKVLDGRRRLLVCEVKGQWHPKLYSAAREQLDTRYAIHPDAARQGIYLALWFGSDDKVAGRKKHRIVSAQELKAAIIAKMPMELHGFIDVFVLDLSKL